MAVSIIDVKVDPDGNFKAFQTNFEKYQAQLAKMPGAFGAMSKDNKAMAAGFQSMTAALMSQVDLAKKHNTAQVAIRNTSHQTLEVWSKISTTMRSATGSLLSALSGMLKFSAVTGVAGGLVGAGSLWGFERLASFANGRTGAIGLGTTLGRQSALEAVFSRYGNGAALLEGASQAQAFSGSGAAKARYLLGMQPGGTGDTAQDALEFQKRAYYYLQKIKGQPNLGYQLQATGLAESGIDLSAARNLINTPEKTFLRNQQQAAQQMKQLEMNKEALSTLQDFDIQLKLAGANITKVLVDKLGMLGVPLGGLSEKLTKLFKTFMDLPIVDRALKGLIDGLNGLDKLLDDPAFKTNVKKMLETFSDTLMGWGREAKRFMDGLGSINDFIEKWMGAGNRGGGSSTGSLPATGPLGTAGAGNRVVQSRILNGRLNSFPSTADPLAGSPQHIMEQLLGGGGTANNSGYGGGSRGYGGSGNSALFDKMTEGLVNTESGGNYGALGPWTRGDRPYGKYQVMGANIPSWTKDALGRSMSPQEFLGSPSAQEAVYKHRMGGYLQQYGNMQDALSMWHSGVPYAQAIREGRRDINMTTEEYVRRSSGGGGAGTAVKVLVSNATGSALNIQTSAAGAGGFGFNGAWPS